MSFDPTLDTLEARVTIPGPQTPTISSNCQCWQDVIVSLSNIGTPSSPAWQGSVGGLCNGGSLTLKYYWQSQQGYVLDFQASGCTPPFSTTLPQQPTGMGNCARYSVSIPGNCCQHPPDGPDFFVAIVISNPKGPCPLPPAECPCCETGDCASEFPIRYSTGQVMLSATDLQAGGFGIPWGHSRSFTNALSTPINMGNGYNWQIQNWPYAVVDPSGTVTIMGNAQAVLWFDLSGNTYTPRFNVRDTLQFDSANKVYLWTQRDGTVTKFSSVSGAFVSRTDPAGNTLSVFSTAANTANVTEVRRTVTVGGTTTIESFLYTYDAPSLLTANLTTLLQRRSVDGGNTWTNVAQVTYTYYSASDTFGAAGDLKTVTTAVWNGSAWANTGTTLYRYYVQPPTSSSSGNPSSSSSATSPTQPPAPVTPPPLHLLKYVVLPASYNQLAGVANPLTASDATVSMYADYYYVYDSNNRVVSETVKQGSQNCSFTSTTSNNGQGYNSWATKTVETLPDGNQNIVYSNYAGQTMLKVFRPASSGSSSSSGASPTQWCTYSKYDANANLILQANPSAVNGFDDTKSDLVNWQGNTAQYLNKNSGLIKTYTYDPVSQNISGELVQQGQWGLPIIVRQYQYISCCNTPSSSSSSSSSRSSSSGSSSTPLPCVPIYFLSKLIEYPDDGSGGSSSSSSSSSSSGPASGTANGNTRQIITTYDYTFYPGTCAVQQKTTTLPVIPASQNGSGVAATRKEYFDTCGNLLWSMDERGYITGMTYDIPAGALKQRIDDVDTTQVTAPAGWTTPSGGGLHLITDYQFDAQGRTTQTLGPVHTIDIGGVATSIRRANWTVYQDATFQVWQGQGYQKVSDGSYTLINPVAVTIRDAQGRVTDQIQAVRYAAGTSSSSSSSSASGTAPLTSPGALTALDSFSQSSYVRWTTTQYSDCCFVASKRVYKLIPATGTGVSGTNYDESDFGYDVMKRQNRSVSPGGTITRTVFDAMGRPIATWVGTNDAGATSTDPTGGGAAGNNMVQVTGVVYDNGLSGGDSNVTQQTAFVDATGTNDRATRFLYDFRNRRTDTDGEIDFYAKQYFDNLDRVFKNERYNTTITGNLIGRSLTNYDDRHRVFQSIRYAVDPTTGIVGNALTDNTWFDASGNTIKSLPAGSQLATKTVFDSLGRQTTVYTGYNYSDTTYATANSVTGDTILDQTEMTYDAANNVIQTNVRQRYHNATGTGPLGSPSSTQPQARVTYAATYPDAIGRPAASADYGTNGGTSLSRPSTIPARSDTCLVTSTTFNARGEAFLNTDPVGTVTYQVFDDAGRWITLIENYIATSSSSSSSSSSNTCVPSDDTNRTTTIAFSPDNLPATITAVNVTTGNQMTTYQYGTTLTNSAVASSLLKRFEILPDSVGGSDQKAFTYNRQGQVATFLDQNGSIHSYTYDKLGRQTNDGITTLGTGVDNAVLRICATFEVRGLVKNLTSYDSASFGSGNIVNDVQITYNSFEQPVTEYQSHSGAVNTSTSPKIQYGYADGSANSIRPTSVMYPNGRILNLNYGTSGGLADSVSRIVALIDNDGTTHLADYSYLGLGTIVQANEPQPNIQFTLIGTQGGNDPVTGDVYRGLDLFDRIKDLVWAPLSSGSASSSSSSGPSANLVEIQHAYDRASSCLYRKDVVAGTFGKPFDELYCYDGMYRLKNMQRGALNPANTSVTPGTGTFGQCWTLDATDNWQRFREDNNGSGTWTLIQTRIANPVNELAAISNSTGSAWITPAYDPVGNMTISPQPDAPTKAFTGIYDAWNRAVAFLDPSSGNIVQTNSYDGRNYRTIRNSFTAGALSETRHYFFTSAWQAIEERIGASTNANRQFVWGLRDVDDLVLRDRDTTGVGTLNERLYALQDALGSVVAVVDSSGVVQERYAYSPYGAPIFLSRVFGAAMASSVDSETLFAGYRYDPETGFHLVRERILNSATGTWLTRDFLTSAMPYELYSYIGGNPISKSDPFGMQQRGARGVGLGGGGYWGRIDPIQRPGGIPGAEIHIMCPNNTEVAKMTETGHYIARHHNQTLLRPSELPKDVRCAAQRHMRRFMSGRRAAGFRPGFRPGRGANRASLLIALILVLTSDEPCAAARYGFDPFGPDWLGDDELDDWNAALDCDCKEPPKNPRCVCRKSMSQYKEGDITVGKGKAWYWQRGVSYAPEFVGNMPYKECWAKSYDSRITLKFVGSGGGTYINMESLHCTESQ